MLRISLSQNANHVLSKIYKVHISHLKDEPSVHNKIFPINSIFHNSDDTEFMSSLVELSSQRMIRVFSDRRIMLNDRAIPYIEKQLKKGLIHLADFET